MAWLFRLLRKLPEGWPIVFFNPFTVVLAVGFTVSRCEGCYVTCADTVIPADFMDVKQVGEVTMPDGEKCRVEEVVTVNFPRPPAGAGAWNMPDGTYTVDRKRRCVDTVSRGIATEKPMVRRLVCPSGRNGTSTVGDDGTKFHRETLQ